jgi:PAS domain S-box-containing protein
MSDVVDRIRVLHVDDDPHFTDLTATYLEREDERIVVRTETNAADALETLAELDFDCIVSDFDMPGQNGIEFLETVRDTSPDLPFILYTGKGSEEIASEAIRAGVTDYLQKGRGTDQYTLLANRIQNAVEQVRANRQATEQHRINRIVREINEALARATTQSEIDERVCAIISDAEPYRFAWIGEHDPETQTIVPRSSAGIEAGYLQAVEITTDEGPTGSGPTGQAVRNGELAVMQNILENPRYEPWREQALERRYRSSAAIPLCYDDTLYGVLNVYAERPHAFGDREQQLLSNVGETIAHAHHRIELQKQYTDQYRALFEEAPVMVVFTRTVDGEPIIDDCNRAFAERLGYTREELRETPLADYYTDASTERLVGDDGHTRALTGTFVREQRTLVTRNGDEVLTVLRASPRRDQDGEIIGTHALYLDITDEQQIQELRRKERRYQAIFNDPDILVGLVDTDGTVLEINQTAMDYIDASHDAVAGTPIEETPWFDRSETARKAIEGWIDRATDGEYVTFEIDFTQPDGERHIFEGAFRPVTSDEGEVVSLIVSGRNITERRERERQLREEQQFTQSLLQSLPDPLYAFDTEGYLLRWNEEFEDVAGYSSDEIEEIHVSEFVPADETDTVRTGFQTIFEDRRSVTIESAVETKTGERIPFELTGGPLEDSEGDIRGMTGIGRDIADRKKYEQRLEALNRASRRLLTAETPQEVADVGVEVARDILDLDANAIHLYDEERSALVPVAVTDIGRELVGEPPTFTGGDSIAWRVFEQGEVLTLDDVHDDPDLYNPDTPVESELYLPLGEHGLLIAGSPTPAAFDQQDILVGEILANSIVTALEQAERLKQLRSRERRLTRQNDRLEEFASIVSHDLRNPLNVAEGRLELAQEDCDSAQLDHIEQAHDRMKALIEDLLVLAREGRDVTDIEAVDLATMVDSCWANVETADATLLVDTEGSIRSDENRLKQVFENLFRNAVEHGGEDVTVTVGELENGFYVEDDGLGIPDEKREAVFEVGYSTGQVGTGFGLGIVAEIVEAHDWDIHLVEGTDGGARFEITGVEFVAE